MERWTRPFVTALSALGLLAVLHGTPPAEAKRDFLTAFIGRYPTSTRLFTCGTCHTDFNGPQSDDIAVQSEVEILNAYGKAFEEAGGADQPSTALTAIESEDSDHDGSSNVVEILTLPGFMPGLSCATYANSLNGPPNLATFVDPADVGCGVVTTTTIGSVTTTTVDTGTTTTTLPQQRCAQPISDGPRPVASDCLDILRAAVGAAPCETECVCAPKGALPITASDALLCLRAATGETVTLQCPCEAPTTTTLPGVTTTTSTTSTTLGGGSTQVGRTLYDSRCMGCHPAGSYHPSGFAPDLAGKGNLLVNNLGAISSVMSGMTLTNQEITDLAAFFDSL